MIVIANGFTPNTLTFAKERIIEINVRTTAGAVMPIATLPNRLD